MEKIPNWLRWILFIPTSLFALVVIYPAITFLSYFFSFGDYGFLEKIWNIVIGSGFTGFCLVYGGSLMVPKYQMIVAIVLTSFYGILSGFLITSKLLIGESASSSWFELAAYVVVGLIGSIIACYQIYEQKGFEV